ncbi:MAG: F420-dependent methylenetetrahydromethanopterin dehydrogenase [Methanophagales archaeon]|nr:F420-dependent methylenetetrahydromethanopterin dehydrogenase [Methanophagales archaeon]MCW3141540.1 F420-dependent methylenetetrahydromethanopterin dehydrogenase [Methanophagales archaeon]
MEVVKVGFVKLGNIGTSRIVDLLLDERADREDIDVRVLGTGAKMTPENAADTSRLLEWNPDVVVITSPNAALPGPKSAREMVKEKGKPCIVISDAPAKKAVDKLKEEGFGYIIIPGDPMIGARREFLDPVEMSLFNADVLSVLSITGVAKLVQEEIDGVIEAIKKGGEVKLPQIIATAERAVERAKFSNPYAKAKAIAAYSMAEKVAELDVKGCFMMKNPEEYVPVVAAAHELLREAAKLALEAREMEKHADRLVREPHSRTGGIMKKEKLMEKPSA